jgi:transposase InsO family protein
MPDTATKERLTSKDPAEKLARQRLSVLELAQALGNASAACRRAGMDRTSFYVWKRRFQTHGLAGLKDFSTAHHSHPQTTPPEVVQRVLAVSEQHPAWGCNKLSDYLKLQSVAVSAPTVQAILTKHGRGSKYERLLHLEARHLQEGVTLTAEQVAQIEAANPPFRERHIESSRPGELLAQDTFYVGQLKGVGKLYLHSVVDTYGSVAFGYLYPGKLPEAAAAVLHNEVLPFYADRRLVVGAVLTDNGREFCGTAGHPFELYLALNEIEHRRTKVRHPQTNGFVERFHRTVLDEFFRQVFRETFYDTVERLQADLDQWLVHYNTERPHQGYRNMGRRPIDTVNQYLATVRHEG